LEERARLLQVQAGEVEALRLRAGQIEAALKDGAFALEARQRIAVLNKEIASLGYSSEAHDAVQAHIRALLPVESELAALEHAREALQRASEARSAAHARLAALAEEKARIVEERAPLQAAILELPGLQQSLLQHRQTLRALREAEAVLQKQVGGLTSQLENARLWALEQAKEAELAADAEGQQWAHHELAAIFGKGGIPAMLIENALPELEQDTNELLARMTDNSTQVQFATQRVGTGGKAIETLEIKIADTLGTRSYEMFSGGEAFRINFAIRIAMSKLLTRNAGADLSFLLIDEGFGTQDDQGRDRLVEAITAVAEDFEKILVVTHIDELKDQFDVHVEVSKGPAGSQISVSAA
jgi:exonuclease SbcC